MPVRCEVWEGFIFINFDNDAEPLVDYLGDFAKGLEGYPFHEMTEHYTYRAEINANWKLFIDAFTEFYHAPILHMKQATKEEADKLPGTASRRCTTTSRATTRWSRRGAGCRRRRT